MKSTTLKTIGSVAASLALLAPVAVFAADAAVNTSATVGNVADVRAEVKITTKTERLRTIGQREIDRRVTALTALVTRIDDLKRLNADAKTNVITSLTAQSSALAALKAKVVADTDEETLKADVQSITDAYRVFALVLPQARIVIMADTEVYVADALLTVGAKLNDRIIAAETAGKDVATLKTQLDELGAKANDAKVQAQAAIELIANLQPDGGDKTVMASNTKALSDARAKLKVGHDDLKAARTAAGKIATALKAMQLGAGASAGASN